MNAREAIKKISYLSVSIGLFIISFYLLTIPSSNEFEISIYSEYPLIFWISIILVTAISLFILFYSSKRKHEQIMCVSALFLIEFILLALPYIRRYFIHGRYDPLVHVGIVKDILHTGYIGSDNFYPIMHIFNVEVNLIGNIDLGTLTVFLPLFFSLLFGIWYFIFGKEITGEKVKYLLPLLFIPILGGLNSKMVPSMFSFCIIPLILFVWLNKTIVNNKKRLLIIPLLFVMVFFHPLSLIYLLLIFLILDVSIFISRRISKKLGDQIKYMYFFKSPSRILVVLVVYIQWYLPSIKIQYGFRGLIYSIHNLLFKGGSINPYVVRKVDVIQRYGLSYLDLAKWAFFRYWNLLIFGFFSILVLVYFVKHKQRFSALFRKRSMGFQYLGLGVFVILMITETFLHFVGVERILKYLIFFLILSFPLIIKILNKQRRKMLVTPILVGILIMLSFSSTFSMYSSPLDGWHGEQVLKSEYSGMNWFFENRDSNIKAYEQKITQYRFYGAIYGNSNISKAKNLQHWRIADIPDHYNYAEYPLAGGAYKKNVYFMISELGKVYVQYLLPNKEDDWRWTPEDFTRLNLDKTANKMYSSRGLEIFLINGVEGVEK